MELHIIVAVIDTGVILAHPDLNDNLVPGYDFISDPNRARDGDGIDSNADDVGDSSTPGASSYHGTHVAGTVSAETNNGIGGAGVAQGARIMPLRALGAGGGSGYDIVQSIRFAAGLSNDSGTLPARRADVINMSLGGGGYSAGYEALIAEVRAQGVIVVAAAGNSSSSQYFYPASYKGVISVSATDYNDSLSYYSNYGGAIDVAAPGGDVRVDKNGDGQGDGVYSTLGTDSAGGIVPSYKYYQGTSMASPHMAGVVALMRAANPRLMPEDIDNLLASGAITTDLGAEGRDNQYGHGLINAHAAVVRASEYEPGAPPAPHPVLVASPSSLSFLDQATSDAQIALSNSGDGELVIDTPVVDVPWLQVGALDVVEGVHHYDVSVDRNGLAVGSYSGTITVTSSANTVVVAVVMQVDAPQCIDIDECELDIDGCAVPEDNGDCRNLPGSYECYCFEGFDGDGRTCADIDECALETDNCSDYAECTNTVPGFTCECLPGFVGDGVTCTPPNECELGIDECDPNAICADTFESYECDCEEGYQGDGFSCADIDECETGSDACDLNGFCTNTIGSYECACSPHFAGDGRSCTPDEGCLALENFEHEWPDDAWHSPVAEPLAGQSATLARRTGTFGLHQFVGSARNLAIRSGELGDSFGVWARLEDVGASATLTFAGDAYGSLGLRADGSGALSIVHISLEDTRTALASEMVEVPIGQWFYLDLSIDSENGLVGELLAADGTSSLASVWSDLSQNTIGFAGLHVDGNADVDGLVACAPVALVDECALELDTCDVNATCGDLLQGYECICNEGWVGDGFSCVDENECETGSNSCSSDASCSNTIGSYSCECNEGFEGDGFICIDVNECELGLYECDTNATCVNMPGIYECSCNEGYEGDGKTCTDIDECALENDDCHDDALCTNTPGSYECSCLEGFEGDGYECVDINECALGLDSCHDAADCFNSEGSYTCECKGGWLGDGFECFDVDECALGTATCDPLAECINEVGYYQCACTPGFSGDGFSCVDIDECSAGHPVCGALSDCSNGFGTYECTCKVGYRGDGLTCTDINECIEGSDSCNEHATCNNTEGSFQCECTEGYSGNGHVCEDVDECVQGSDACSPRAVCSNTLGAYACDCREGFSGDGFECLDVDECAAGTFECPNGASCSNQDGGYTCECERGYRSDGEECVDIATQAQSVRAGDAHTCALMNEGVVKCWGSGRNGRTGHGNSLDVGDDEVAGDAATVRISELAVLQVEVGGSHSCALLEDFQVRCWGTGADGRLGHADHRDIGDDEHPADGGNVQNLQDVVMLALGQKHSCALRSDGKVSCWGGNAFGQLGAGPVAAEIERNDEVDLGGVATAIVAGDYHSCALLDSGDVVCWGLGSFGRLGYGKSEAVGVVNTPADVGAVSLGGSAIELAAGANHSCAILADSSVRCWGRGLFGALGSGVAGDIGDNELPSDVPPLVLSGSARSITAGRSHTCVATTESQLQCFGRAADGQLGYGSVQDIGDNETPNVAGFVELGGSVVEVDAGAYHTCATLSSGAIRCWGNGSLGRLGYGNSIDIGDNELPASAGDVPMLAVPEALLP